MWLITISNIIFRWRKVQKDHVVVCMTFPSDVLPLIRALHAQGKRITVIAKPSDVDILKPFAGIQCIPAGNKYVLKQMYALSVAKVIIIDTYYLMFGGFKKKRGQYVLQTWHAAGALKTFGFEDHQVDMNNARMVAQYRRVYDTTDYYFVGGAPMVTCFKGAFDVTDEQCVRVGLPRMETYKHVDVNAQQQALKSQLGITGRVVLYVPTYREHQTANRRIDAHAFKQAFPNDTLIQRLHPSVQNSADTCELDTQSLMIMADIIVTDYSSLAIEASYIHKPVVHYVYDEADYASARGLNTFYYAIPEQYKAYDEATLFDRLTTKMDLQPQFDAWHTYTTAHSLEESMTFIERLMKS